MFGLETGMRKISSSDSDVRLLNWRVRERKTGRSATAIARVNTYSVFHGFADAARRKQGTNYISRNS